MSFSRLPAELKISIFENLENSDLKAVRAVCTAFRDNATARLFRSMVVCLRYRGLSALDRVARNEVLSKCVVEIVLDGSQYISGLARNQDRYRTEEQNHGQGKSWNVQLRWRRYKAMYDEQQEMVKDLVFLHTVAKAIACMPKLRQITWSPGPCFIPFEKKSIRDLHPPVSGARFGAHECESVALQHLISAIHCEQITQIKEFITEPSRTLEDHGANLYTLFPIEAFRFQSPASMEAGRFFFGNLHKLHLDVFFGHPKYFNTVTAMLGDMKLLLSEIRGLCDLKLHLPDLRYRDLFKEFEDKSSIFPLVGPESTWPSLQSLNIGGIYASETQLLHLIDRHQRTLRFLRFELCGLEEGKWANIVNKAVCLTSLSKFTLAHTHEAGVVPEWISRSAYADGYELHTFNGELKVGEDGCRYFEEPQLEGKKTYAWRDRLIPSLPME